CAMGCPEVVRCLTGTTASVEKCWSPDLGGIAAQCAGSANESSLRRGFGIHPEAAKRPGGSQAKQQQRNRRAKKYHRDAQEIPECFESIAHRRQDRIDRPAHD